MEHKEVVPHWQLFEFTRDTILLASTDQSLGIGRVFSGIHQQLEWVMSMAIAGTLVEYRRHGLLKRKAILGQGLASWQQAVLAFVGASSWQSLHSH